MSAHDDIWKEGDEEADTYFTGEKILSKAVIDKIKSDGSTASYYELPKGCTELQHLISYRDMNAQIGEMFRSLYRYGKASHSDRSRDLRKVIYYAEAELARLVAVEKGIYPEDKIHPEEEIKGRL